MPRGLEVSLPEELQPAVLEPALVVDWLARWVQFRQSCRLILFGVHMLFSSFSSYISKE